MIWSTQVDVVVQNQHQHVGSTRSAMTTDAGAATGFQLTPLVGSGPVTNSTVLSKPPTHAIGVWPIHALVTTCLGVISNNLSLPGPNVTISSSTTFGSVRVIGCGPEVTIYSSTTFSSVHVLRLQHTPLYFRCVGGRSLSRARTRCLLAYCAVLSSLRDA